MPDTEDSPRLDDATAKAIEAYDTQNEKIYYLAQAFLLRNTVITHPETLRSYGSVNGVFTERGLEANMRSFLTRYLRENATPGAHLKFKTYSETGTYGVLKDFEQASNLIVS